MTIVGTKATPNIELEMFEIMTFKVTVKEL